MKQLRIYFKSKDCEQLNWCYVAENAEPKPGHSIDASLKQLVQTAQEIIFIIPQYWVYETSIDVADKNAKQLLTAAAYQLEDQFAEDVDDLHFAQGQEHEGVVSFVVIQHLLMENLLKFEKNNQMTATHVIHEISLCATPIDGEVNVYQYNDHYLFKTSDVSKNTLCAKSQIDFFMTHFKRQNSALHINRLDEKTDNLLCAPIDLSQCINLKQKTYSVGRVWQLMAKSFAFPIVLLLLLSSVFLFNIWQANQQSAHKISQFKQQQSQLLSRSLVSRKSTNSAKTTLIKALQKQQSGQQKEEFLAFFQQLLQSKQDISSIKLVKVNYKNKKLSIDVSAKNLQQLDQLINALKAHFKVTVSQMDSSNNESQGRLVLEQR